MVCVGRPLECMHELLPDEVTEIVLMLTHVHSSNSRTDLIVRVFQYSSGITSSPDYPHWSWTLGCRENLEEAVVFGMQ
jgi:hypothetical protein